MTQCCQLIRLTATVTPRQDRRRHRTPICFGVGLLLVCLAGLPGCRVMVGGERTIAEENDRLRAENLALQRQVNELESQLEQRRGEADNLRQQLAATRDTPAIENVATPTLSRLAFDRHTGPVDTDGDDRHDLIRIYLRPLDQQGRLLPVAGRATVQAVTIPESGEPQRVAQRIYEPDAFDRAWREGFTGTHYTLELPLPETLPAGETPLTIRVTFLEATSGVRLSHQQPVTVQR